MSSFIKSRPIKFNIISKDNALNTLKHMKFSELTGGLQFFDTRIARQRGWLDDGKEICRWELYISGVMRSYSWSADKIYEIYLDCIARSDEEPMVMSEVDDELDVVERLWVFKGFVYEQKTKKMYTYEQAQLLILEEFDKERRYFEKLKIKFTESETAVSEDYKRPRISEKVRVEVWRRDGGKCARCGSREKLEYDHIVPISKGGSNTARNIELLCEKCNRSKSNNVV